MSLGGVKAHAPPLSLHERAYILEIQTTPLPYNNVIPYKNHSITLTKISHGAETGHARRPSFHERLNISECVQIPTPKLFITMLLMIRHIQ